MTRLHLDRRSHRSDQENRVAYLPTCRPTEPLSWSENEVREAPIRGSISGRILSGGTGRDSSWQNRCGPDAAQVHAVGCLDLQRDPGLRHEGRGYSKRSGCLTILVGRTHPEDTTGASRYELAPSEQLPRRHSSR